MLPISVLLIFSPIINSIDVEFYLDTIDIINYWGYPTEVHHVTTDDGFILEVHRIVNHNGPVVFLQHCLLGSSFEWVANPPNQSAGYALHDAGYDVWMGNFRGNRHSRKHVMWQAEDREFWDWSWDQLAEYDLEAMIRLVISVTGKEKVDYVGHSLGTLTMFAKLSKDPQFPKLINRFVALAPIETIQHVQGVFSFLVRHFGADYQEYNDHNGPDEFFGNTWLFSKIAQYTCGIFDTMQELCSDMVSLFVGPLSEHWNMTRLPVYLAHTPAGTSSNVIAHLNQMGGYGGVPYFDMGPERNRRVYGRATPPQYNFAEIRNVSIYLFWSDHDWISTEKDLNEGIFKNIDSSVVKGVYKIPEYNHLEFVWGTNVAEDIFKPIIKILSQ